MRKKNDRKTDRFHLKNLVCTMKWYVWYLQKKTAQRTNSCVRLYFVIPHSLLLRHSHSLKESAWTRWEFKFYINCRPQLYSSSSVWRSKFYGETIHTAIKCNTNIIFLTWKYTMPNNFNKLLHQRLSWVMLWAKFYSLFFLI